MSARPLTALSSGTPAYVARPSRQAVRGLVLFPDIMGLRPLFFDMCDELAAEHGWAISAIELWPGQESLPLESRLERIGELDDTRFMDDAREAAGLLDVEPVAVLGFCMGGMLALKAATLDRFDRAVSCYGMIRLPGQWRSPSMAEPIDVLPRAGPSAAAKVLAILGTEDPYIPPQDAADLEALGATVVTYEGADHGFMHDRSRPTHRAADAADAWRRIEAWLAVGG
jgi:carboxymethylenebutenolidase